MVQELCRTMQNQLRVAARGICTGRSDALVINIELECGNREAEGKRL